MTIKNNVTRFLDARRVPYKAHQLPTKKLSAMQAADLLGVDPWLVYKSIVATRPEHGKNILALVPGPTEVDLKALARALDEKKLTLSSHREAEHITGLQTGGISPLALLQRPFDVVLDESALLNDLIYISGGQRGLNISLSPVDLMALTEATIAPIARSE